jgi:Zn-dependent alcohol dehydrogenase
MMQAKLIGFGIAGIGLLALLVTIYVQSQRIVALKADLRAERTAHAVTRESVAELKAAHARFIADGQAREQAAADALQAAIDASRGISADAARLAARAPSGKCSSEHLKGIGL